MEKKQQLFAEERKEQILALLSENDKLLVPELCDYFHVSPATIRNDLRELESTGMLKRTHGGALSNSKTRYEPDSYQKEVAFLNEKKEIARLAINLVEDGDTIAIDTGTTTLEFAKLLSSRKNLTVVTNDIEIARTLEMSGDANIILAGGVLRRNFHCLVGPIAVASLKDLSVDKAFMGTNGVSADIGFTTPDLGQAEIKKVMASIANEITVLCDSSKIGTKAFAQFLPLSKAARIITDSGIDDRDLAMLRAREILVEVVEMDR